MLFGKEHVERYEATGGEEGHRWENGTTTLLLHTKGRKSGKEYTHPLIYRKYGDEWLVVASNGGMPEQPAWYLSLQNDPDVSIQLKADTIPVRARTATAAEKPAMWAHMLEVWPDFATYQQHIERDIPIVVLTRRAG
jgi:deazaflavin-dependent oxidoreductase (nitroreductase family)